MAVLSVMLVTTVLVSLVMLVVWDKPLALVLPFFLFFFIFEGVYFTANIRKARTSQFQASTCHIFKTTFWRIGHFPDFPLCQPPTQSCKFQICLWYA